MRTANKNEKIISRRVKKTKHANAGDTYEA